MDAKMVLIGPDNRRSVDLFPQTGSFFDMFPQTGDIHPVVSGHVETVVLMSKKNE